MVLELEAVEPGPLNRQLAGEALLQGEVGGSRLRREGWGRRRRPPPGTPLMEPYPTWPFRQPFAISL